MTLKQKAQKHFETHNYPFNLSFGGQIVFLTATTEEMVKLTRLLENLPEFEALEAVHPEFLGWTVEEIRLNYPD